MSTQNTKQVHAPKDFDVVYGEGSSQSAARVGLDFREAFDLASDMQEMGFINVTIIPTDKEAAAGVACCGNEGGDS